VRELRERERKREREKREGRWVERQKEGMRLIHD
jgi:hypothetical protein